MCFGKMSVLLSIYPIKFAIVLSSYGQNPNSISNSTTPIDHISALML